MHTSGVKLSRCFFSPLLLVCAVCSNAHQGGPVFSLPGNNVMSTSVFQIAQGVAGVPWRLSKELCIQRFQHPLLLTQGFHRGKKNVPRCGELAVYCPARVCMCFQARWVSQHPNIGFTIPLY